MSSQVEVASRRRFIVLLTVTGCKRDPYYSAGIASCQPALLVIVQFIEPPAHLIRRCLWHLQRKVKHFRTNWRDVLRFTKSFSFSFPGNDTEKFLTQFSTELQRKRQVYTWGSLTSNLKLRRTHRHFHFWWIFTSMYLYVLSHLHQRSNQQTAKGDREWDRAFQWNTGPAWDNTAQQGPVLCKWYFGCPPTAFWGRLNLPGVRTNNFARLSAFVLRCFAQLQWSHQGEFV